MAATANGTLTPPHATEPALTTADTPGKKRKREDEPVLHPPVDSPHGPAKGAQTQRDVLAILQQYDTAPSFLEHAFDDSPPSSTNGPSQKKARLADGLGTTTICAKLSSGAYSTLMSLKDDAAHVSKALEISLRAKGQEDDSHIAGRLSVDDLKRIQRAKAFQGFVDEIVDKENRYDDAHDGSPVKQEKSNAKNGPVPDQKATDPSRMGTVLTLFGNAPTPKQLFSSMQNAPAVKQERTIKSELPVEEMSLPNGLAATKIMPTPADYSKKAPTFEDTFAPPFGLPPLHPPKAHKRSSTRDTTITWEFKDPVHRSSKKGGYTVQSQMAGNWLGYGGVDAVHDASPRERRKQRDRALSSGAESVKETPSKAAPEELQAAEEAALFRRAYGSFAPCVDDAKSVLPAETKSMIWWHQVGEKRFNETFAIDPALLDEPLVPATTMSPVVEEPAIKDADLERAVNELTDLDESSVNASPSMSKTDVEQVLREVAELLETLASHQRIRNSTLPSLTAASRTPISPAPLLASRIGKPDEPAEDEISTYNALRRELGYLILKLPPYAVAKIDGDQLAELGVSRLIPFQSKDVKGTMEEDQVARLAKYNTLATAAGIATLTRGGSSSSQHYSTTAQRTPAIGQAANTRYGQTPQYKTPAPVAQLQRSTSTQPQYGSPGPTAPRPGYAPQANQYTRPGAPQQQSSYSQPAPQLQYYQQQQRPQPPPAGYGTYNPQYSQQQTPQPQQQQQRPTYSTSQPLAQYQQRSHAAAANAVAYQTNAGSQAQQANLTPFAQQQHPQRIASPAKPAVYGGAPVYAQTPQQQQAMNVQPRPVGYPSQQQYAQQLPTSGRATPVGSQAQTPVGGGYQQRP
ncbi:hypothetical protein LTR08_005668 [Meristemomyces frigidus]|nr:hypothetical protein LTR08_005668 [Meristemomyces frigidus]